MISYGSGGCGGCVRFIERVDQPLFDGRRKENELVKPKKTPRRTNGYKAVRLHRIPVLCIERFELFPSIAKAAEWVIEQGLASNFNAVTSAISNVIAGRQSTAYGMHWKRMDGKK